MIFRFTILFFLTSIQLACNFTQHGAFIAKIENDGSFTIKSKEAHAKILGDLKAVIKDFKVSNTKIVSLVPLGDKHEKVYFIEITDEEKQQKLSRFLFLKDDKLYFFEDLHDPKVTDDNMFYESYYSVIGKKENNCYPNIAYTDGELYWTTGTELVCAIDSPCESQQHVFMKN